ncbi:hypothetical protein CHUAL_002859 [Chamberlinius hualienensis]
MTESCGQASSVDDLNHMISPASSPCGKVSHLGPKGSSWVQALPEAPFNIMPMQEFKDLRKKRKFIKGGFAEQLEKLLFQQQKDAMKKLPLRSDSFVKLKIKDVYKAAGLIISLCSKIEKDERLLPMINEEKFKLVVQSNSVKSLEIISGSVVTIHPPWQLLQSGKNHDEFHLIGPVIVKIDDPNSASDLQELNTEKAPSV